MAKKDADKFRTQNIRVKLEGTSALLMHNPTALDPFHPWVKEINKLTKKQTKTEDDMEQIMVLEWKMGLYYDDKMGVHVPNRCIKGTVAAGATPWMKGSTVKRALEVPTSVPLIYKGPRNMEELVKDFNYRFVARAVVGRGSSVTRTRPRFFPWSLVFNAEFLLSELELGGITDYIEFAGKYKGMLDGRIIGFGRFKLAKIEKTE